MSPALRYGARSDVGLRRSLNEDSMYAGPRLLAIADGMGGHAAGEVASRVAIETVAPLDRAEPGADLITGLRDAVETASDYLRDMAAADSELDGMGTTLTALLFAGHRLGLVHIGDSRAYLLRDATLTQITHDHTLVQTLIDEGRISADEAATHPQRSWITRSLTGRGELELDLSIREVRVGDRYLLCSDGLSGVISEETIAEALREHDPQQACDNLVDLALRAGGPDNITCIVADVVGDEVDAGAADPIVGGAASDAHAPSDADDSPAARAADAASEPSPVPAQGHRAERRRRAPRYALLAGLVVLLIAAGLVGSWLYIRTQFYVGAAHRTPATVAIYRGVSGSVLGVDLGHVDQDSDLPVDALPEDEQAHVRSGIDATSKSDAQRIVTQLRRDACAQIAATRPLIVPTPSPSQATSSKQRTRRPAPKPSPSPSPMPSFCGPAS